MKFEIEDIVEKTHPLIDRTEYEFKIVHFGAGTPNRLEVKNKIVAMKNLDEKLTITKKVKTHFGDAYAIGRVYAYKNLKDLEYFEPFHIRVRNLPLEKRNEIIQLKKKKEPYKHLFV
ncbi:MAG: hypothetical protein ACFFBP_17260 [Promethearchaeota archaeon]